MDLINLMVNYCTENIVATPYSWIWFLTYILQMPEEKGPNYPIAHAHDDHTDEPRPVVDRLEHGERQPQTDGTALTSLFWWRNFGLQYISKILARNKCYI